MDAIQIANKARKSIGKFCIEECSAYCCRKGYLVMSQKETHTVLKGKETEVEAKHLLKTLANNRYSLYIGNSSLPCPKLKYDFTCSIHKCGNRPAACKDFPLFIEGNQIKLSDRCPAVKLGLLYPYIAKLLKIGFKLSKENSYAQLEPDKIIVTV